MKLLPDTLTDADVSDYADGRISLRTLAVRTGHSVPTVRNWIKRRGVRRPAGSQIQREPCRLTDADVSDYAAGRVSIWWLGRKRKAACSTVSRWLREKGIATRSGNTKYPAEKP